MVVYVINFEIFLMTEKSRSPPLRYGRNKLTHRAFRTAHHWKPNKTTLAVSASAVCSFLVFVMAALCNRAGHYIFALWFLSIFYLSFFSFPRLISAAAGWMSAILWHMVWPSANLECRSERCCTRLAANAGPQKVAKNRHLVTYYSTADVICL